MPIAHKQGNYIANQNTVKELESNDQIAFKYHSNNPNGSILDAAAKRPAIPLPAQKRLVNTSSK